MKRGGRIKPVSARRARDLQTRAAVVEIVHARAGGACWYAPVVPEIRCRQLYRDRLPLEVDELRGGAYRVTEWLDPDRCRLTCQAHHDFKTDNKLLVLDRLAHYEETHPWPTTPTMTPPNPSPPT